jgi:pimeloyl-ACP methyl ester carboxylesterase
VTGPAPRLAADVAGTGPAVVLLHGQPGSAADWDPLVPLLTGTYTVVAADRVGYGRTGGRAAGFAANATATVDLLDRLEVDRAILVGHSWAGGVALAAAEDHPDRVAGLVLLASVGPGEPFGLVDRLLATRPLGLVTAAATIGSTELLLGVPAFRDHVVAHLPPPARSLLATLRRPGAAGGVWRTFADEQRALVEGLDALAGGLGSIRAPTTVVTGTSDRVVAPVVGERLAAAIPEAELIRVPHVGHRLAHEAPRAVHDAIGRTVRRAGL